MPESMGQYVIMMGTMHAREHGCQTPSHDPSCLGRPTTSHQGKVRVYSRRPIRPMTSHEGKGLAACVLYVLADVQPAGSPQGVNDVWDLGFGRASNASKLNA